MRPKGYADSSRTQGDTPPSQRMSHAGKKPTDLAISGAGAMERRSFGARSKDPMNPSEREPCRRVVFQSQLQPACFARSASCLIRVRICVRRSMGPKREGMPHLSAAPDRIFVCHDGHFRRVALDALHWRDNMAVNGEAVVQPQLDTSDVVIPSDIMLGW